MHELNLTANTENERLILEHLKNAASAELAEKINNGARIEKDGKQLINKKTLADCWTFITNEARKELNGKSGAITDATVYGWAVHYFEEDSIAGTLYNEDGTPYKKTSERKPAKESKSKSENSKKKSKPAAEPEKAQNQPEFATDKPANGKAEETPTPKKRALKGQRNGLQISLFDFTEEEANTQDD